MLPIVQQRLIGSILLLCVLIGVAYFLIDSATDDVELTAETTADIPFISSIDAIIADDIEIIEMEQEALIDAQQPILAEVDPPIANETVAHTVEQKPVATPALTPAISSSPAWLLQVVSLSDRSAAESLRTKIQLLGYEATVEKAETVKGVRFRVRIGPEQDKLALEATAKTLETELNLKPLMLKHTP